MGVVTNTLDGPTGEPLRGITVRVRLIAPHNPFLINGTGEVLSQVATVTDTDGTWSVDLLPSSQLESVNAYYLVDETCAPGGQRWAIAVPDGPGPFLLRDVLISTPPSTDPDGPVMVKGIWYHHDQHAPAQVWTIAHGMGFRPNLRVKDTAGSDWYGWSVTDESLDSLTVDLGVSMAGTAELS